MPSDHRIGMLGLPARAIKYDELDQFRKLREAMPGSEPRRVVFADQIEKLGVGFAFAQRLHRVNRVGRRWSLEFHRIEFETRLFFDRGANHFQPSRWPRRLEIWFMRRSSSRDEDHQIER